MLIAYLVPEISMTLLASHTAYHCGHY